MAIIVAIFCLIFVIGPVCRIMGSWMGAVIVFMMFGFPFILDLAFTLAGAK